MRVLVKPDYVMGAMLQWGGRQSVTDKHYSPYNTHEDDLDGTIVESVVCVETGEVTKCPPHLTLTNFEGWVRSNFTPSDNVRNISYLS